jgi:hypothetical protein
MKKIVLLLTALFFVGGATTALADDLLLSLPPILAKSQCKDCVACTIGCTKPCTPCSGVCCGGECKTLAECPNCCEGVCSTEPCSPTAATGKLNDTGITWGANYPTGNNTTCTGAVIAAQDCSHGNGGFNFTKISEGICVRDEVTGLVWSNNRGTTTWDNRNSTVTTANSSNLCGINNWRIPTVKELVGIVSYYSTNPAIDGTYFPSSSTTYWTNIPDISNASNAWAVDFNLGRTTRPSKTSNTFEVRLVSGEIKTNNFEPVSDGILDRSTGLVWKKCLEGLSGDTCATNTASTFTWQDALNRAIAAGGAWRLPNIKELQTLVDESTVNPATYKDVFPGVPVSAEVWSSSPYADSVTAGGVTYWKSWSVNASGMVTTPLNRASDTLHVRLVRDCTGSECD